MAGISVYDPGARALQFFYHGYPDFETLAFSFYLGSAHTVAQNPHK